MNKKLMAFLVANLIVFIGLIFIINIYKADGSNISKTVAFGTDETINSVKINNINNLIFTPYKIKSVILAFDNFIKKYESSPDSTYTINKVPNSNDFEITNSTKSKTYVVSFTGEEDLWIRVVIKDKNSGNSYTYNQNLRPPTNYNGN